MSENTTNPAPDSPLGPLVVQDKSSGAYIAFQIENCPECGVTFALPVELYIEKVEKRESVYCCNGHAIALHESPCRSMHTAQVKIRLLHLLEQARHETDRLRRMLAECSPSQPVDEKEFARRLLWLENRAKLLAFGRRECRFCSRVRQGRGLRQHLKADHRQEIIDLDPEFFT